MKTTIAIMGLDKRPLVEPTVFDDDATRALLRELIRHVAEEFNREAGENWAEVVLTISRYDDKEPIQ